MEIIIWIVFGAIVGCVGSLIMGTNDQQGIFLNIVVAVIGAIVLLTMVKLVRGK